MCLKKGRVYKNEERERKIARRTHTRELYCGRVVCVCAAPGGVAHLSEGGSGASRRVGSLFAVKLGVDIGMEGDGERSGEKRWWRFTSPCLFLFPTCSSPTSADRVGRQFLTSRRSGEVVALSLTGRPKFPAVRALQ